MSSSVVHMKRRSDCILSLLVDRIENFNSDSDLILRQISKVGDQDFLLMVFEKGFIQAGSTAVLTIQEIIHGEAQSVTIVGTGGGEGVLNISLGANNDYAYSAAKYLEDLGFEIISENDVWLSTTVSCC